MFELSKQSRGLAAEEACVARVAWHPPANAVDAATQPRELHHHQVCPSGFMVSYLDHHQGVPGGPKSVESEIS